MSAAGTGAVMLHKYCLTNIITARSSTVTVCLYCTDREGINTTEMTNAHAQFFVVNNQFLLTKLKAFTQFTRSLLATRNASCFQSVRSSRNICRCPQSLYSGASHIQHPRTTSDTPTPLSGLSAGLRKCYYKCKDLLI